MKIEFFIQSGSKYLGILILVQALKKITLLCTNLVSTIGPRHFRPQDDLCRETTLDLNMNNSLISNLDVTLVPQDGRWRCILNWLSVTNVS